MQAHPPHCSPLGARGCRLGWRFQAAPGRKVRGWLAFWLRSGRKFVFLGRAWCWGRECLFGFHIFPGVHSPSFWGLTPGGGEFRDVPRSWLRRECFQTCQLRGSPARLWVQAGCHQRPQLSRWVRLGLSEVLCKQPSLRRSQYQVSGGRGGGEGTV